MPQQMALNIYRGDCYHWTFTFWTDPAGEVNKFQFHMSGTMSGRDGQERPIDRTTTVLPVSSP